MTDEVIKKIKESITELNAEYMKYHNWEQGTKIMINSFYGGLANPYMYFFDPCLAECITKQGKNAILYAESNINYYFQNKWYDDKETHRKLGVHVTKPVTGAVTVYIDTDSCDKSTLINISDIISIETSNGLEYYHKDDMIKVLRDNKEIEIKASDIKESDLIWQKLYQKINKISNPKNLSIEDLYNACVKYGSAGETLAGHESVNCPFDVLNYNECGEYDVYYAPVKRVIRHKVKKKKWKLVSDSGKYVIVTNDHSIIVFRGDEKIKCKPDEIKSTDYVLTIVYGNKYKLERVKSIECIGEFEDEYVYDIEINDDTHTFIANDILVHNSVYSHLDEVISTTDWKYKDGEFNWKVTLVKDDGKKYETRFCGSRTKEEAEEFFKTEYPNCTQLEITKIKAEPKDFALRLDEVFLAGYFKHIFNIYAEKLNADNYLNFELETYSDAGIWLAKKKYMQNIRWTDSMPRHDILEKYSKIKSKGVELIQPSSPTFARKKLTYLVRWIFEHENFILKDFVAELKKIRDEFNVANPDEISWNKKATEYTKWVLDDVNELTMAKGTPITTKGIAYYNYILNKNPKYKTRYSALTPGTKCKYYYCLKKDCEMFAYEPGMFPIEFAPEIDRKLMFEKTILTPINRIIEAIGFNKIESDLVVLKSSKLF